MRSWEEKGKKSGGDSVGAASAFIHAQIQCVSKGGDEILSREILPVVGDEVDRPVEARHEPLILHQAAGPSTVRPVPYSRGWNYLPRQQHPSVESVRIILVCHRIATSL
jgi:hypothetical protein